MPRAPKPDAERKKITQACEACIRKKCKCDGSPICQPCQKSGIQCVYGVRQRRGPKKGFMKARSSDPDSPTFNSSEHPSSSSHGGMSGDEQHSLYEQALANLLSSTTSAPLNPFSPANISEVSSSSSSVPVQTSFLSNPTRADSLPLSHFTQFRVPDHITNGDTTSPSLSASSAGFSLAKNGIRYELIDVYFQYVNPFYNVIHKQRFMANMHLASPYVLHAIYAITTPYAEAVKPNSKGVLFAAGDDHFLYARKLLDEYLDAPDIWTVSATLLLSIYACSSGREAFGWLLQGLATRLAQQMNLHNDPNTCYGQMLTDEEIEERRSIWWVCYELDRYAGGLTGRPMSIAEDDFTVCLPKYKKLTPETEHDYCMPTNAHAFFVVLLQVYTRIMKYCRKTLSGCKLTEPPSEQLKTLDKALKSWLAALPSWMISYRDAFETGRTPHSKFYRAYVHIFYHTCAMLLRAPSLLYVFKTQPALLEFHPHFTVVKSSADAVTSILRTITDQNPEFYRLAPFVSFCIALTGLVHSVSGFQEEEFDFHVKCLTSIGRMSQSASADAEIFKQLKKKTLDERVEYLMFRLKQAAGCPGVGFFKSNGEMIPDITNTRRTNKSNGHNALISVFGIENDQSKGNHSFSSSTAATAVTDATNSNFGLNATLLAQPSNDFLQTKQDFIQKYIIGQSGIVDSGLNLSPTTLQDTSLIPAPSAAANEIAQSYMQELGIRDPTVFADQILSNDLLSLLSGQGPLQDIARANPYYDLAVQASSQYFSELRNMEDVRINGVVDVSQAIDQFDVMMKLEPKKKDKLPPADSEVSPLPSPSQPLGVVNPLFR